MSIDSVDRYEARRIAQDHVERELECDGDIHREISKQIHDRFVTLEGRLRKMSCNYDSHTRAAFDALADLIEEMETEPRGARKG